MYEKMSTDSATNAFRIGNMHLERAKNAGDIGGPVVQVGLALNAYATALVAMNIQLVNALNDALERLDRLEQKLNLPPGPVISRTLR